MLRRDRSGVCGKNFKKPKEKAKIKINDRFVLFPQRVFILLNVVSHPKNEIAHLDKHNQAPNIR